jgi:hypothetical protein
MSKPEFLDVVVAAHSPAVKNFNLCDALGRHFAATEAPGRCQYIEDVSCSIERE